MSVGVQWMKTGMPGAVDGGMQAISSQVPFPFSVGRLPWAKLFASARETGS